jgi:hypothetical protein
MSDQKDKIAPSTFYVKDCALASIATGIKAQTLSEFSERLKTIPAESIYYHFWRGSLESSLAPGAYFNDFSLWAHYHLHDDILAERLALLDPSEYVDLEKLRSDILEVCESRMDEEDGAASLLRAEPIHFILSKIVVFNTAFQLEHPRDLVKTLPHLSRSSIFYHMIDARRREPQRIDDFSAWMEGFGEEFRSLVECFRKVDPYFITLADLQKRILEDVNQFFLKERDTK